MIFVYDLNFLTYLLTFCFVCVYVILFRRRSIKVCDPHKLTVRFALLKVLPASIFNMGVQISYTFGIGYLTTSLSSGEGTAGGGNGLLGGRQGESAGAAGLGDGDALAEHGDSAVAGPGGVVGGDGERDGAVAAAGGGRGRDPVDVGDGGPFAGGADLELAGGAFRAGRGTAL